MDAKAHYAEYIRLTNGVKQLEKEIEKSPLGVRLAIAKKKAAKALEKYIAKHDAERRAGGWAGPKSLSDLFRL